MKEKFGVFVDFGMGVQGRLNSVQTFWVPGCLVDVLGMRRRGGTVARASGQLLVGDYVIGRGSRQRALDCSSFSNDFKVSIHDREYAISKSADKLWMRHYARCCGHFGGEHRWPGARAHRTSCAAADVPTVG